MKTINRLSDILVSMNTSANWGKLFKIIKCCMVYAFRIYRLLFVECIFCFLYAKRPIYIFGITWYDFARKEC